ncbi:hypothetical protein [Planktomarina sp.]|uniref:hypothetical protein n=1 Tax=Planktomarina sp. TaxID=2024851 RepID=UPI00325FE606
MKIQRNRPPPALSGQTWLVARLASVTLSNLVFCQNSALSQAPRGLDTSGFTDMGRAELGRSHLDASGSDMFY